jgi:hypothetical protein
LGIDHPDLVTHDDPGFRTRISTLTVFRLGKVLNDCFVELSRSSWPKQTKAFELRYKTGNLGGLPRGSPWLGQTPHYSVAAVGLRAGGETVGARLVMGAGEGPVWHYI